MPLINWLTLDISELWNERSRILRGGQKNGKQKRKRKANLTCSHRNRWSNEIEQKDQKQSHIIEILIYESLGTEDQDGKLC